jgi:hypothetical protein
MPRWAGYCSMHRDRELHGQNGERPRNDRDTASMGRALQCCIETVSCMVKTAKDHATTETQPRWVGHSDVAEWL